MDCVDRGVDVGAGPVGVITISSSVVVTIILELVVINAVVIATNVDVGEGEGGRPTIAQNNQSD